MEETRKLKQTSMKYLKDLHTGHVKGSKGRHGTYTILDTKD